jgi:hypothetical protein
MPKSAEAPAHHISVKDGKGEITLGRALSADEEQSLVNAIVGALSRLDAIALSVSHVVHVAPQTVTETVKTYAPQDDVPQDLEAVTATFEDGDAEVYLPYWHLDETRAVVPFHCPDCGRDLEAANPGLPFDHLVCPVAAPLPKGRAVTKPGDFIACGRER